MTRSKMKTPFGTMKKLLPIRTMIRTSLPERSEGSERKRFMLMLIQTKQKPRNMKLSGADLPRNSG